MLFQLDITRMFQIYVVQGIFFGYFLLISFKVFNRRKKQPDRILNTYFGLFYLCIALGLCVNFIYALLTIDVLVLILYYSTLYLLLIGLVFLLLFNLILLKSDKLITKKKQKCFIFLSSALILCMILIPDGVVINSSTSWKPVYNLAFFLYVTILLSILVVGPCIFYSVKIYFQFQDEKIKKKWKLFFIGLIGLYIFAYGTLISNYLNLNEFRVIWSIISLCIMAIFPLIVYYGIIKNI